MVLLPNNMKRLWLILIVLLMFVVSCGVVDDDVIDGNSFDYYQSYQVDNCVYEIYLPTYPNDLIYYQYDVSKTTSDKITWTINYIYEGKYHVKEEYEDKQTWINLYNSLSEGKEKLDELCGCEVELFNPYEVVEREFTLENPTKESISYVCVDMYLPIKLYNQDIDEYYIVGIPVKTMFLIMANDLVQSPITNEFITWDEFLSIPNMKEA